MSGDLLREQHCKPCAKGTPPLDRAQAEKHLAALHADWTLSPDGSEISRTFTFGNYYQTMAFVNALAWVAHTEDHHPDIEVGYKRCHVRFSTHMIGGLSDNDFICAARIDALFPAGA
jgi:4a-hydroxytetrahydrobiopterin dehydratase